MALSDEKKKRSFGVIAGLYFWRSKPGYRLKILVPFFFHSSTKKRAFTWALPLNFYWRRGSTKNLLIIPLAYHRGSPRSASSSQSRSRPASSAAGCSRR